MEVSRATSVGRSPQRRFSSLSAAKYSLDRLVAIVDYNGVQQTGTTHSVMPTEPIATKWESFNWHVLEVHGHNMAEVLNALDFACGTHGQPTVIIARTTKDKGVEMTERAPKWHGGVPDDAQFESAFKELEQKAARWRA